MRSSNKRHGRWSGHRGEGIAGLGEMWPWPLVNGWGETLAWLAVTAFHKWHPPSRNRYTTGCRQEPASATGENSQYNVDKARDPFPGPMYGTHKTHGLISSHGHIFIEETCVIEIMISISPLFCQILFKRGP